jgi:hypothetical protein
MATSIVGTFPILSFKKSQTDEYGFNYVSYQYTIKTSDLAAYNIKKDDVFDGIETWHGISWTKNATPGLLYVVDTVESKNTAGGLTELTINTVGTKNIANPPRVNLISGGPLIFGLLGTQPSGQIWGYGVSGAGQSVEVKFLASGGAVGQQEVFTRHFSSAMPTSIGGISLPAPARAPGRFNNDYTTPRSELNPEVTVRGDTVVYYGFVCKTILTEKRGSLLLVTLVFSEAGYAYYWPNITGTGPQTAINRYNFARIG